MHTYICFLNSLTLLRSCKNSIKSSYLSLTQLPSRIMFYKTYIVIPGNWYWHDTVNSNTDLTDSHHVFYLTSFVGSFFFFDGVWGELGIVPRNFITYMDLHNHITQSPKHPSPQRNHLMLLLYSHSPALPPGSYRSILHLSNLTFWECYRNGITQYVTFWVGFFFPPSQHSALGIH